MSILATRRYAALVVPLLLVACAAGPDYRRTDPVTPAQWQAPLPHDGRAEELTQWWSQFDDPLLPELIDIAQHDNPGLQQALARIAQSRAGVAAARAKLFPEIDANAMAQRGKSMDIPQTFTLRQATLDASWEVDLFGAARRGREAALARQDGSRAAWHDARVSLAAEVAQEYVGLRACEATLNNIDADLVSRRESQRLTQLKVGAGFAAPADASLAEASAADGAARRDAQRAECDISVKALVALTGLDEAALRQRLQVRYGTLPVPARFSVSVLPADLLRQRPDLAASEREVAAASAEIGVAEAARFPGLAISGSIGRQQLDSGGGTLHLSPWSIVPALTAPLFDAGRRAAGADAARARYAEAYAAYSGLVRQAVREVEQDLVRLDSAGRRAQDAQRAAEGYARVEQAAEARWRAGTGSLLELEEARRVALGAQAQWLGVRREHVAAWIALYRAMGGGWSAAEPVAENDATGGTPH